MSKARRIRSPRTPVLLLGGTLLYALGATEADAACVVNANVETCDTTPPATPRDHDYPPMDTLVLQGGASSGTALTLTDGLSLTNFSGGPVNLSLTNTGFVTADVRGNAQADAVHVVNQNGLITLDLGRNFFIRADATTVSGGAANDNQWGALASVVLGGGAGDNSLSFDGTIEALGTATQSVQGVLGITLPASQAITRVRIGGDAAITVVGGNATTAGGDALYSTGAAAYGFGTVTGLSARLDIAAATSPGLTNLSVTAAGGIGGLAEGQGDVQVASAGNVSVVGRDGVRALAGLRAHSMDNGFADLALSGGTITVRPGALTDTGAGYGVIAQSDQTNGTVGAGGARATAAGGARIDTVDATGIAAVTLTGAATVGLSGGAQVVTVRAPGAFASTDSGTAAVTSGGATISTTGDGATGIYAHAANGTGVSVVSGNVATTGANSRGIDAYSAFGQGLLDTRGATVSTSGNNSDAALIDVMDGTPTGGNASLRALTGALSTSGASSVGLHLRHRTGTVDADTTGGAISATGAGSRGLWLETFAADSTLRLGDVSSAGAAADAVLLEASRANLTVTSTGTLRATGAESRALAAIGFITPLAAEGTITATINGIADAAGQDGVAAYVDAPFRAATLNVGAAGVLNGGWDQDSTAVSTNSLANGGAILIASGGTFAATINNAGTVGARSDRLIATHASSGALTLNNSGTMTGFWDLAPSADVVVNTGALNLRNFSDGNGNGTRETKRVATLTFGAGDDVFRNEASGILRVANVSGATTTIADHQYLPDLMSVQGYATSTPGVEQAHLVQLERFEHRGTITLRDMDSGGTVPVAGDVLLMTSGTVGVNGALTPGAAPMVFVSDGGVLALDTELNQGGAASHSDMLVVDSVQLGASGLPTRILVTNAGGIGAATIGDGIKLVDVLGGGTASAPNAFRLGAPVAAGAFTYNLFRSGLVGDDGDWYLRTAPAGTTNPPPVTPPPVTPPPGTPPPPPPVTYRPEAALFAALPAFLRSFDAAAPGSRQARLGDEAGGASVARRGRVWARYVTADIDLAQTGTVAPSSLGDTNGYQFGVELYGGKDEAGAQIGFYAGRLTGAGTVSGFANGVMNTPVGRLEPDLTYAGVYVSRSPGRGLYFDAVLQYGRYGGQAITFADGQVADIRGSGGYASLETGYGFAVAPQLVIEPQFQIVAQPQHVQDVTIVNARVSQVPANTLAGRGGLRIKGDFGSGAVRFQPYVTVSYWHGLDHQDRTRFSGNGLVTSTLDTGSQLQAIEYAGGLSVGMGSRFLAFAQFGKLDSTGDSALRNDAKTLSGGLRFAW